ncbi:MAG: M56 family metallopeptidase, partial [Planctomycetota bacterium]
MIAELMNFDWFVPRTEPSVWICWLLLHSLWVTAGLGLVAWFLDFAMVKSVHWKYCIYVFALLASVIATPIIAHCLQPDAGITEPIVWNESKNSLDFHSSVVTERVSANRPTNADAGSAIALTAFSAFASAEGQDATVTQMDWARVAPWVVLFYATGVLMMLVRLLAAIASTHRLRRNARPLLDGPVFDCVQRVSGDWGMRTAKVAEVINVATPIVVGLLRPTILLPAGILSGLNAAELEMVLRHELAHIRRRDVWVQFFQRLAEAALFFNPSVWLISRQISRLREYCCDEIVCGSEADEDKSRVASSYAAALLAVAEMSLNSKKSRLVGIATTGRTPSELRRRVQRVLGEPVDHAGLPPLIVGVAAFLMLGICLLPAWAESGPLDSLKQLGIPISTITMEGGDEKLQELAESTGG